MDWLGIIVKTDKRYLETVITQFYAVGANGLEIDDPSDIEMIKKDPESWSVFDESDFKDSSSVTIKAYFEPDEGREALLKLKSKLSNDDIFDISTVNVKDEDWSENWKKYYHSFEVGEKLWITPVWEDEKAPKGRFSIKIDPGMAFGTGTHETTRLCLEALEKYVSLNSKVLDIGTGSGILAMAAVTLGASFAVGVDIDPAAVKVARENVSINGLSEKVEILQGDLLEVSKAPCDLLVSNIVAEVLLRMLEELSDSKDGRDFRKIINPNGIFISSGIIKNKEETMREGLEKYGFEIIERREDKDWVMFAARCMV